MMKLETDQFFQTKKAIEDCERELEDSFEKLEESNEAVEVLNLRNCQKG